jgi:cation transport regulator ChaC
MGWRLILPANSGATLVRERGAVAYGVLWRFQPHHAGLMDRWENVAGGVYRRRWLRVESAELGTVTALTYISDRRYPGQGKPSYINSAMLFGAEAFGLPIEYAEEIRSWLPRRPIGAHQVYRGRRSPKAPRKTAYSLERKR